MLKARLAQMHMHINQTGNQQLALSFYNLCRFVSSRQVTFDRCNDSVLNYDMLDFQFAFFVQYAGVSNDHCHDFSFCPQAAAASSLSII
ncbi:hypothetical protein D3C81_2179670 [compost metagenome]